MNVLVCGARGFIGAAIVRALRSRGHRVVEGVSPRGVRQAAGSHTQPETLAVDFVRDVTAQAWLPRLRDLDAVVNAVGVLRDSRARPIAAVHEQGPCALFEACAQAGVRRVVQVSALGIDDNETAYARTKRAAEACLAALTQAARLDGVAVRPSIVFGRGGASSGLFLALSRLPALVLPGPVRRARVQPIAVDELAQGIAALVERLSGERSSMESVDSVDSVARATIAAVGPEAVTLEGFIASLRAQAGRAPACVAALPGWLTRWSARAGDAIPIAPWCSETLALLAHDNVASPAAFERLLGRAPTRFDHLLAGMRA